MLSVGKPAYAAALTHKPFSARWQTSGGRGVIQLHVCLPRYLRTGFSSRVTLTVEYALQRHFDLASFGRPLDPVFGDGGPGLRAIDHQSAELCRVRASGSGSGGASSDRLPVQVFHFII